MTLPYHYCQGGSHYSWTAVLGQHVSRFSKGDVAFGMTGVAIGPVPENIDA